MVDLARSQLREPLAKLQSFIKLVSPFLGRAVSDKRWLSAHRLASLACTRFFARLHCGITPTRFLFHEFHNDLDTQHGWGGRVRMMHRLKRDLK
jgi:hypothetical protein